MRAQRKSLSASSVIPSSRHVLPAVSPPVHGWRFLVTRVVRCAAQVTMGTARLLPNIRFAPLRFQCARVLNQLSMELGYFTPVPL